MLDTAGKSCPASRPTSAFSIISIRRTATPRLTFSNLRSEEHTSELQSLMRISYAVFCLKKKIHNIHILIYKLKHILPSKSPYNHKYHHTLVTILNQNTNNYISIT